MFKGNPQESRLNGLQRILLDTLTPQIIGSLDDWWGGRAVTRMLPRLFFDDFSDTSFVVADAQADGDAHIVGFLCGYTSQSSPGEVGAVTLGTLRCVPAIPARPRRTN